MKITFLLPAFSDKPIGGYKVVYQYANYFISHGFNVQIVYQYLLTPSDEYRGVKGKLRFFLKLFFWYSGLKRRKSLKWFPLDRRVEERRIGFFSEKKFTDSNFICATSWETATYIHKCNIQETVKLYFIQGFETWSGSKDEVERTWHFSDLHKIVISTGLQEIGNYLKVKTKLIKNFIDQDEYFVEFPISKRKQNITMLYHENKVKGSADGIEALVKVKDKFPNVNVIVFGTSERPTCVPKNFQYIRRPDMRKLYNKTSIFVSPSHGEGWGLTATEAMACGSALVTTNSFGTKDFAIDNNTALVSDVGDIEMLRENVIKLLRDDQLRQTIAQKGSNLVKNLSISQAGDEFVTYLNSLYTKEITNHE